MAEAITEKRITFTQRDREMLQDVHAVAAELRELLPQMRKAAAFVDNPAARFRDRFRKGDE